MTPAGARLCYNPFDSGAGGELTNQPTLGDTDREINHSLPHPNIPHRHPYVVIQAKE